MSHPQVFPFFQDVKGDGRLLFFWLVWKESSRLSDVRTVCLIRSNSFEAHALQLDIGRYNSTTGHLPTMLIQIFRLIGRFNSISHLYFTVTFQLTDGSFTHTDSFKAYFFIFLFPFQALFLHRWFHQVVQVDPLANLHVVTILRGKHGAVY